MVCFIKSILTEEMRKLFTKLVPQKVLSELGWSNPATYAEVFDFLAERGMLVSIYRNYDFGVERFTDYYDWMVDFETTLRGGLTGDGDSWENAALNAVISCLTIIKENNGKRNNQS